MEHQALGAAIGGIVLIFCLVAYLFFALCMAMIAKKVGKPFGTSFIMAIIPIANMILFLQIAKKPLWWVILLFIPIVSFVVGILVWMAIAERLGRPSWWGVVILLVPVVNLVLFLMLAFGKVPAKIKATA